ncbi:hypothetical protein ACVWW5_003026 [Bradyrhizobium sp. LM3.4]
MLSCGRGSGIRDVDCVGAAQHLAQIGLGFHGYLGVAAANRQRGLDPADICDGGGGDEILLRELRKQRLRQDDEIGRRPRAQLVGHDADRAELTVDTEAGLRLEGLAEAAYQALRRTSAQNIHCRHDASFMAAMILARVIGRSRTRTPRQS